jgi:hypothetical protein
MELSACLTVNKNGTLLYIGSLGKVYEVLGFSGPIFNLRQWHQ